jgi:ubiquinone biosynthesis protein UbiJ
MLLAITAEGRLQTASEQAPAVTLWLDPSTDALFEALQGGARGLRRHLRIDGDVMFAGTLGELAEHLRWDAEEDVSRLIGDVAAHRLAQFFRQASAHLHATRARIESSTVQYLTAEDPQLVAKGALASAAAAIGDLQTRLDRLEARLAGSRPS